MHFDNNVLTIDPKEVAAKIETFIRDTLRQLFKRRGIVIGLSGGIDSSVAAALSVKAIGAERVHGLLLPERDSNPKSREYGRMMAESLGIQYHEVDITPVLESFGVYEKRDRIVRTIFPRITGPYKFRLALPQDLLDRDRISAYHLEVLLEDGSVLVERLSHEHYLELMAANDIKQRTRMTQLYYEAERRYYIVCGTTNLSEAVQGFFVKYGDGGVDIEPIAYLYKRQVFQLGEHLGVPREILERTPSPDTYSYEVSDKDFYFCVPYETLDLILYAVERDVPRKAVAEALGLTVEQVDRAWRDLVHKRQATEHLRQMPPAPVFKW